MAASCSRFCLRQPLLSSPLGSWAGEGSGGRQGPRGRVVLLLLLYEAQTLEGGAPSSEQKLTWVHGTLLPFRVGNDLVFVHHLDVLVLHLVAAEREKTGDPIRPQPGAPATGLVAGLAAGRGGPGLGWGAPDGGVLLLGADVQVLGEEDGVVGHCGLARGQDAPNQVAHHGQDPIIHEQVVHQELNVHRGGALRHG